MTNGTFYYVSDSKEKCLSYSYCWTPESMITGLLTLPNEGTGECPSDGRMESVFTWESPKWIGGTWAFTNWTSRQSVQTNTIRKTIDFVRIQEVVAAPSALTLRTFLQNQVE